MKYFVKLEKDIIDKVGGNKLINGAKWWKFDFHTHTPASFDYGKGENHSTLQNRTPRDWLLDHMEKEIDCVAVTDHNSGAWIDVLKEELLSMEREQVEGFRPMIIFPGVEISVNGGIHLLAIFDPTMKSEDITAILSLSGYHGTKGNSDETTTKSFTDVVENIHNRNGIAIPAHVDQPAGLFTVSSGNTLRGNLKSNGLLAIQICDINFPKPSIYNELKLNFAEVTGSDSHRPEHVGSSYTWVKMQTPNIEALRLALHDGNDAILHSSYYTDNPNDIRHRFFIRNISVKNASKAGRGRESLKVDFSPWLTALIGGRGSGKSSIIEFLRLTLGKQDDLPKSLYTNFEEFSRIYQRGKTGMLMPETEIRVELCKDGREIALIWKNNLIEEEIYEEGIWVRQESSNIISQRFPLRIYSQKQLYEMTKDPQVVLKLVDKQLNKRDWQTIRNELESEWLDSRRKERNLKQKFSQVANLNAELKDIGAKLKIFEDTDNQEVLHKYQNTMIIDSELNNIVNEVNDFSNSLNRKLMEKPNLEFNNRFQSLLDDESLTCINENINKWRNLYNQLVGLIGEMTVFSNELPAFIKSIPWHENREKIIKNYTEFLSQLEQTGEKDISAHSELVNRKRNLEIELEKMEKIENEYMDQVQKSKEIKEKIFQHEKELRSERAKVIQRWNANNNDLRILLEELGDTGLAESTFRNIIRKEGTTFHKDIFSFEEDEDRKSGLIYKLRYEHNSRTRWEKRDEFINRLIEADEEIPNGYSKPFIKHIKSIMENNPEDIDRLMIWFPEDQIVLKLVVNGKEENIDIGSAGQRTAAMLSLLLSLDETPIIIDQPEDDLDTRRITDLVVKGVRQLKTKQQVIVVTHNPNIPVNGAAEQIVHLNFAGGQIHVNSSGALQDINIRKAVCDVMEGGSEALSNRYYRIFKALES